jgi:rhodanese-related sulfurtransferase
MQHSPGFLKVVDDAKTRIREVTVEQVLERQARGVAFEFIDVREDNEWDKGHAAGARHIGRGVLERDIEALVPDPNREIILYCGGGFRSALSADNLQKMGYRNVYSMAGGIREWRAKGLPEEK